MEFVSDPPHEKKPLLTHGFSIGSYLCGETLVELQANPEKYGNVGPRIQGHILDSPSDHHVVPFGVSYALLQGKPVLQKAMQKSLESYLSFFKNSVTCHFEAAQEAFFENRLQVPTLFLYSDADPVGLAAPIEALLEQWKERGLPHFSKCFAGSPHVSHFHHYPVEYLEQVNSFLNYIRLQSAQDQMKNKGQYGKIIQ